MHAITAEHTGRQTVLVTGGAGYIGSHAVLALQEAGYAPVALDDLSTGVPWLVPEDVPLVEGDVGDPAVLERVFEEYPVRAVMHFAGSIIVGESFRRPLAYYRNNVVNTLALLEACAAREVAHFVFSSSAAVYGAQEPLPITEEAQGTPLSPYGWSKWMAEQMLEDAAKQSGMRYVALRYFNVAGADAALRSGQVSRQATHLVKIIAECVRGIREVVPVCGTDYPTPDGTCIRDYVHVSDLAAAHVHALRYLQDGGESRALNCGYGHGYSVREMVRATEALLGRSVPVQETARRPGDPPALVASNHAIGKVLGWKPRYDDLPTILASALAWEEALAEKG